MIEPGNIIEPDGPDLRPVFQQHRGASDAWIAFSKGGKWKDLCSIRADAIPLLWPVGIDRDSFHSIHSFHHPHVKDPKRKLASHYRKTQGIKYLTACYADIDFHKGSEEFIEAAVVETTGELVKLAMSGALPPFSMLKISGRGVWPFWWLQDDKDTSSPAPHSNEVMRDWFATQHAIRDRLVEELGPRLDGKLSERMEVEPLAYETAMTRVPGSRHSAAGRRVAYWLSADEKKKPFRYTLPELMEFFDVKPEHSPAVRRALRQDRPPRRKQAAVTFECGTVIHRDDWEPDDADTPRMKACKSTLRRWVKERQAEQKDEVKARGGKAVWFYRLTRFEMLLEMRGGGFKEGSRHRGCFAYARILKANGMRSEAIVERVLEFAARCDPPFPKREALDAIGDPNRYRREDFVWRNVTIMDWLNVTAKEARMLDECVQGGERWAPYRDNRKAAAPAKVGADERRGVIRQVLAKHSKVPSTREMAVILKDEHGIDVTNMTVYRDYKDMGIKDRERTPGHNLTSLLEPAA